MNANKYELTYVCTQTAISATEDLDALISFLREQKEPVTCKTIGKALYGERYCSNMRDVSHLGKMLSHLRDGGFIEIIETKGAPITIYDEMWVAENDENGEPAMITVFDERGNQYKINNPKYKYNRRYNRKGRYEKVPKTIYPTIKFYAWVEA